MADRSEYFVGTGAAEPLDGGQRKPFPDSADKKEQRRGNGAEASLGSTNSRFARNPAQVTLPTSAFPNLVFQFADKLVPAEIQVLTLACTTRDVTVALRVYGCALPGFLTRFVMPVLLI